MDYIAQYTQTTPSQNAIHLSLDNIISSLNTINNDTSDKTST